MRSWLSDNGLESGVAAATNLITLLRIVPPLTIPLMGVRAVINGRMVIHNYAQRFDDRIKFLQDPDNFARLMRATKPLREKTDNHELQDAVVLLKMPETFAYLQKHRLDGKELAIADPEHAAGEDLWNDPHKQEDVFREAMQDIIDIRLELAKLEGKEIEEGDWYGFGDELVEHFAKVRVFKVGTRPEPKSIEAVEQATPEHSFTSERVEGIIRSVIDDAVRVHVDHYPGGSLNDF